MTAGIAAKPMAFDEVWCELDAGQTRIRTLQAGQGEPVVVLPGSDGRALGAAYHLLSQSFRVICLDAPAGRGVVESSLQALGVGGVGLLARSESAVPALRLAASGSARVRAVVLESPSGVIEEAQQDPSFEESLRHLPMPVLILLGTRDRTNPPDRAGQYRALIARSHVVLVYDASAAIARDRPDAFADLVGDYVQRQEAFVVQQASGLIHP